jgi:benzil reductase ((S)-benzoin forming)
VVGVSRTPIDDVEHLQADLSTPEGWRSIAESFAAETEAFSGERLVLIQAAGTIEPMGFAAEVDDEGYSANVMLNSAAPQVIGHLFLKAVHHISAERHIVTLTSGAASNVYPGWTSYGAGKAAVDQWTRVAGAEQATRGGVRVIAVAPGVANTAMQNTIRRASEHEFPARKRFVTLYEQGRLWEPEMIAEQIWLLLSNPSYENGSVVDLRDIVQ